MVTSRDTSAAAAADQITRDATGRCHTLCALVYANKRKLVAAKRRLHHECELLSKVASDGAVAGRKSLEYEVAKRSCNARAGQKSSRTQCLQCRPGVWVGRYHLWCDVITDLHGTVYEM